MPCLTAAGRDGVLVPVNKQKTRQREERRMRAGGDETLHHSEHRRAEDDFLYALRTFTDVY